jgi:ABC-2 type transport system ATP-binding protein
MEDVIEVDGLTKRFATKAAVDGLSFTVQPGVVTGFLGPNGAGKTTTMRVLLGLAAPTSGTATIGGKRYADIVRPTRTIGALLDARAAHGARTAHHHLLCLAQAAGLGRDRVAEVLDLVGLTPVAKSRVGTFSLGMSQRLGIAVALLGDPPVLIFDEPLNGLDPEGIRWIRGLMRGMAGEGRTVLVSSHLMSEMALVAERLVVIGRGQLIADTTVDDFVARHCAESVLVRADRPDDLTAVLHAAGAAVATEDDGALVVTGLTGTEIGKLAQAEQMVLSELTPRRSSLEDAFMDLTRDTVEYGAAAGGGA